MRITRNLAIGAAGAAAIAASAWLTWGTATFADLDVRATSVRGAELGSGTALLVMAALAVGAVVVATLVPRAWNAASAVLVAAGLGVLTIVATVAGSTPRIVGAATEAAAGRIAEATGLPAERLATLLRDRVGDGSTVHLGIGVAVAAIGASLLLAAGAPPLLRRTPAVAPPSRTGTERLQPV